MLKTRLLELYWDLFIDHGEWDSFFCPMHVASNKLDELTYMTDDELNSRFSTTKTKLMSVMNRYIKDLQRGFVEHDSEMVSNQRNWKLN